MLSDPIFEKFPALQALCNALLSIGKQTPKYSYQLTTFTKGYSKLYPEITSFSSLFNVDEETATKILIKCGLAYTTKKGTCCRHAAWERMAQILPMG